MTSSIPDQMYDNGSEKPKTGGMSPMWKPGPLTTDPLVWHRFRFALGHFLIGNKESPYDETEARRIAQQLPHVARQIREPPDNTTIDPLFTDPLSLDEFKRELKKLPPDKSPGPDGITNRMLKSGGDQFDMVLFEFLNAVWQHEIQPTAWETSLLQPIYKAGNKEKEDPASYRGIYLSNSLAKFFEGIILHRLTQYTEAYDTLTMNQLGTRPNRQTHDAIYSLLTIIQHNNTQRDLPTFVAFLDYSTAYPSVHQGRMASLHQKFGIARYGNTSVCGLTK